MVVSSDNVVVLKRTESKSDSLRNKGSSRHFTNCRGDVKQERTLDVQRRRLNREEGLDKGQLLIVFSFFKIRWMNLPNTFRCRT
jgi:hypothetical protein